MLNVKYQTTNISIHTLTLTTYSAMFIYFDASSVYITVHDRNVDVSSLQQICIQQTHNVYINLRNLRTNREFKREFANAGPNLQIH